MTESKNEMEKKMEGCVSPVTNEAHASPEVIIPDGMKDKSNIVPNEESKEENEGDDGNTQPNVTNTNNTNTGHDSTGVVITTSDNATNDMSTVNTNNRHDSTGVVITTRNNDTNDINNSTAPGNESEEEEDSFHDETRSEQPQIPSLQHPLDATAVIETRPNNMSSEDLPLYDIYDGVVVSSNQSTPHQTEQEKDQCERKNILFFVVGIFLFSSIVVVSLFVALRKEQDQQNSSSVSSSPSEQPSSSPSSTPSSSPTSERFQSISKAVYGSFDPPRSPPSSWFEEDDEECCINGDDDKRAIYRAMNWLANEDGAMVTLNDTFRLRQRFGLAVLYFSTGGEYWVDDCGFLSEDEECDWNKNVTEPDFMFDGFLGGLFRGVFCGAGVVQVIYMMNMNMTGVIPNEISMMLPDLVGLVLRRNALSGTIPSTIWDLQNLVSLGLSSNKLSGTIPPLKRDMNVFLKDLSLVLNFADNLLTGTIPPSLLHNKVSSLFLPYNLLTGTIPKSPPNENLHFLILEINQLNGTLPFTSGLYPNLQYLYLGWNNLVGSVDPVLHFPKLHDLVLIYNEFSGTIPSSFFSTLNSIELLYLNHNNLSGRIPDSTSSATKLKTLSFLNNSLVGSLPSEIGKLTQLETLGVGVNNLNGTLPWLIGNMKELKTFDISSNSMSGSIPESFGKLSNMTTFYAFANSLNGTIPSAIGNMTSLKELSLFENQLSGTLPTNFVQLTNLEELELNYNNLNGNLSFLCGESYNNLIKDFWSDCFEPDLFCSCCTVCCVNNSNISDCDWKDKH